MDKQRAVNTVTANDEYSKQLMKMYENWMDGNCFQGSNIKEATFKSVNGELPDVEYDKSSGIPTPSVVNSDDGSQKDPKSEANPGEPPVALKGTMTIGQGSMSTGQRQSHGAQIRNTTLVSKEEVEIEEKMGLYANIHAKRKRGGKMRSKGDKGAPTDQAFKDSEKTAKKEEVELTDESMKQARKNVGASTCWDGYKAKGTKKKGGKVVPNCVKAGFEPDGEQLEEKKAKKDYDGDGKVESGKDEYFGSRDKAIKKAMAKRGMKKEEIENVFSDVQEHHRKDEDGNTIPHEEVKTEEWKSSARKLTAKIMSYYGSKERNS